MNKTRLSLGGESPQAFTPLISGEQMGGSMGNLTLGYVLSKQFITTFQEDTRLRVLRALQEDPRITQRQLSSRFGVSLGAINYVLRALLDKGVIKIQNFRGNSQKLRYAYILTPLGLRERAALTANFLARKTKEYEALQAEIAAVRQELEQKN